jgi:hypothetical protein
MYIHFAKVPAKDGRTLAVNTVLVEAFEDKGATISICVGGNWIELNMTADEFINKCNEPFKDSED